MQEKRISRGIRLGKLAIGGGAPVMVQSMTNTDTRDVEATLAQIDRLVRRGCEAVRVAVPDMTAAKALPSLPPEVHLVIVGRRTPYTHEVERFVRSERLENRVHIIHNLPFDDLPAVYQCAELFVYPSRFEGFGIPIIEALQSGIPVVAATGSCLEEAGGPDSVYVHPDDVAGMARAFNDLLADPARRALMVERGKAYATCFSEEKQAGQLAEVYRQVLAAAGMDF